MAVTQISPSNLPSIEYLIYTLSEYLSTNITITTVDGSQLTLQAAQQTLTNVLSLMEAYNTSVVLNQEYSLLDHIFAGTLNITPQDTFFVNSRLAALQYLYETIYNPVTLPIWLDYDLSNLPLGVPAVTPNYDLLSYYLGSTTAPITPPFMAETPPLNLTIDNFYDNVYASANAWYDVLISLQASATATQSVAYDAVNRMYQASMDVAQLIAPITSTSPVTYSPNLVLSNNPSLDLTVVWNTVVALPTMLRVASLLFNDPSQLYNQATNAIKYLLLLIVQSLNTILASFIIPTTVPQPVLAKLRAGETLMDFANRTTGNFEQWSVIATINNLFPPYVGTMPAPGIATPGTNLYLPPGPALTTPTALSNYEATVLGTDVNLGPPGTAMANWTGDFSAISGYDNFSCALVRRILTPIGSLIFHQNYGSILPLEVGNISTASEARLLLAYLKSTILSDPRSVSVPTSSATPGLNGQVYLAASVVPIGTQASTTVSLALIPKIPSTQ